MRDPHIAPDITAANWPASTPVSPAARAFIEGATFEIDGDLYWVDRVIPSGGGAQTDVLIVGGHESMRCDERTVRRAMQVRDVEELIEQDRASFLFGPNARKMNLSHGWSRGGRTLASLGIELGGEA